MSERTKVLLLAVVLLLLCGGLAMTQLTGEVGPGSPGEEREAVMPRGAPIEEVPPAALPVERSEKLQPEPETPAVSSDPYSVRPPPGRPSGQTGTAEPAEPGVIAGRILADDTGRPLDGVLVMLGRGKDRLKAVTDIDGAYRFENVGAGVVRLVSFRSGYALDQSVLMLKEGQGVAGSERTLRAVPASETGAVEGHVTDATGQAEAGVNVVLHLVSSALEIGAKTDESGRFELSGLPIGWFNLSVVDEESGLWMRTRNVEVVAGETVVADIRGYGALSGVVLDPDGEPAAKALITVSAIDEAGPRNIRATADEAGRYRIENAGLGEHRLWVYYAGSSAQIRFLTLTGSDQEEDIRLPAGRVRGELKGRVAGVGWVGLYPADNEAKDQHPLANCTVAGGREFQFRWIAPGRYRIRAHGHGRRVADATVEIPSVGEAERVVLRID